jgi:hypothetical protein
MKRLCYEEAKELHEYQSLKAAIVDALMLRGRFSKEEIAKTCQLSSFVDSIHWDYLVRMIKEEYGDELMPMAQSYFKKHRKDKPEIDFPGTYIATGHGKKTYGYALANRTNGHFVLYTLETKKNRRDGVHKAVEELEHYCTHKGIEHQRLLGAE